MKGFDLTITLKDDCVLSERATTEGGHAGLDYLPGATLLGAAAAKLYRDPEVSKEGAFTLFHSGQVCFGNGLPVSRSGEASWPVPLTWHHAKGVTVENKGRLNGRLIWSLGGERNIPGNKQPQQLRAGYVTTSGILVKPKKSLRMKTAINPETGCAFDAMLFGYDALHAGQTFRARISVDENVSDHLLNKVKQALCGELLLGRSRSAEYGRVQAERNPLSKINQQENNPKHITLWLLSDLAALDNLGQPTLFPKPEWLGLPEGELMIGHSSIRTRRYSPWNNKRGGPDLERQVISQGSVLVFDLKSPLNGTHCMHITGGLGVYREVGLGQVWLNPPLLEKEQPEFSNPPEKEAPADPANGNKKSPLIEWLELQQKSGEVDFAIPARGLAKKYRGLLASACKLKGLDNKTEVGPSHSQWGSVLALAKSPAKDFTVRLFDNGNGPCKPTAPGWQDEHWDEDNKCTRSFAQWLRDILGKDPDPHLVRNLAREVMDVIKKEARQ